MRSVCIVQIASAWGGAERHTLGLAQALVARGHPVRVLDVGAHVLAERSHLVPEGVEVVSLSIARGVKHATRRDWLRLFELYGADIVVLAKGTVTVGSRALDRAAASRGRTFVTIEHCVPPPPVQPFVWRARNTIRWINPEWIRRPIRYWVRSLAPAAIVCVSEAVRTSLIDTYRFPQDRTLVVRNGTDVDRFAPDDEARKATRSAWGIPDSATVVGALARFNRIKGLDELVTAFAAVHKRHRARDFRLVLVGEGPEEQELRARAAAAGVAGVTSFPGPTPSPWAVYPALDVFAMPSRAEGLPLSLLEAMACGVAPVSYDVGGVGEVIVDATMGSLVPARDAQAFESALERAMLAEPATRRVIGEAARRRAIEAFDASESFERLADVLEAVRPT